MTTSSLPGGAGRAGDSAAPMLDVVVPVFNEEGVLAESIERLHGYLGDALPFSRRIVIADNASTDATADLAAGLAAAPNSW